MRGPTGRCALCGRGRFGAAEGTSSVLDTRRRFTGRAVGPGREEGGGVVKRVRKIAFSTFFTFDIQSLPHIATVSSTPPPLLP